MIALVCLNLSIGDIAICQWQWAENVTRLGALTLGRNVVDIAISGEYAYCADNYGLSVWDLSEPERPTEIARTPTPGLAHAVAVKDNHAFIADLYHGLQIFDISQPLDPHMAGFLELEINPGNYPRDYKITIRDNVLFLCGPNKFWIISIEIPLYPEIISVSIPPQQHVSDFVLNDDIAYLSQDIYDGLLVVNIENLEAPELIRSKDVPRIAAFALQDTLLYCVGTAGDNDRHFTIYNVSNPEEPEVLREYNEFPAWGSIFLDDDYAYAFGTILDITDPLHVELIGTDQALGGRICAKMDDIMYSASGGVVASRGYLGIFAISITDPEDPILVNEDALHSKYQLKALDVEEGFAHLQALDHSYLMVNVENQRNPSLISEYVRPFRNPFLKKYQHYVYYGAGGIIIDVQNPDQPDSVGDFGFWSGWPGRSADMYVLDEYAYVPGKHSYQFVDYNLLVLDLSDPTHPDSVGIRRDCQMPLAISSLDGTLLYQISILNDWNDATPHVFVYSLEEPGRPEYLGRWPVGPENRYGLYMKILVHNSYAYVWCDAVHELWIYSVEDPVDPRFIRSLELGISSISDMSIDDDIIYLGGSVAGFGCMSITDPENPEIVGYYDTPGGVCELKGINGYVYVTDYYELGIYDCAELHGIWNLQASEDSHNFGYSPPDSTAVWELMLTNAAEQAVQVLSVTVDSAVFNVEFNDTLTLESDEETSILVTFTPTEPRDYNGRLTVHTERRDVIVELRGTGVPLSAPEELHIPSEFTLHPVYPNPFNSVTQIRYDLPKTTKVALTVYNVMGREVIRLVEGQQSAGYHNVSWRGISANGTPVTSGVYFVRLEAGSFVKVNKLTLIR